MVDKQQPAVSFADKFKHTCGGKLSASNYSTARAAHLVKHCVAFHDGSKGYRDVPLELSDCILEQKKYNRDK